MSEWQADFGFKKKEEEKFDASCYCHFACWYWWENPLVRASLFFLPAADLPIGGFI